MNTSDAKRVLEAALICAQTPLSMRDMRTLFGDELGESALHEVLAQLQEDWRERGLELVTLANGWRFQTRPFMRDHLEHLNPEKPPSYSRAVLETLAIVAYRQPVTRGDIEDIRGVAVSPHIIKQLEERGWIESVGFKPSAGRPALFATTPQFLNDLGLPSLHDLPAIDVAVSGTLPEQVDKVWANEPVADVLAPDLGIEPDEPTQAQDLSTLSTESTSTEPSLHDGP